jgi:hypothetical protein
MTAIRYSTAMATVTSPIEHDETFLDALVSALRRAGVYNRNDQEAPVVVLWTDGERQWESVIPRLREQLPLVTLGAYQPAERTGPAYWLRAMLAGQLDDQLRSDATPIIYLPGVSKAELRAVEECPRHLQPLAALQFTGTLWLHKNGRDWTVPGFIQATEGGLGIEVTGDTATRQALARALPKLAAVPVAALRKEAPLRAAFFDSLLNPDDARSLLLWLSDPARYRQQSTPQEWAAFCGLCGRKYGFNPETDGPIAAAQRLATRREAWQAVWDRFSEAPHLYPGLPDLLRQAQPAQQLALFEPSPVWPQFNEAAESQLRAELTALAGQFADAARRTIAELEQRHAERRAWVWSALGQAPLATALEHLNDLARATQQPLGGGSLAQIAEAYAARGWQVDQAVLLALAKVDKLEDVGAVKGAIRAIYRPWLEATANAFQATVAGSGYPRPAPIAVSTGTCVLFCDALRLDVAQRLLMALRERELTAELRWQLAALPGVTATAKPAVSPASGHFTGDGMPRLEPALVPAGAPANAEMLRRALTESGFQVLKADELGDPTGRGWTEQGSIDAFGHQHGWKVAHHLPGELRSLEHRIKALLDAGWKQVVVCTDHGWLLLPGNLPKAELPEHLTAIRKGRCARVKDGAQVEHPTVSWHWDQHALIAMAPGLGCYEAGKEYEHGGLSPQECVVPLTTVKQPAGAITVRIEAVTWRGMRCSMRLTGATEQMSVDIRQKAADPSTSLVKLVKSPLADGSVSLLVEDEDRMGQAAFVVVFDESGSLRAQTHTTIGE